MKCRMRVRPLALASIGPCTSLQIDNTQAFHHSISSEREFTFERSRSLYAVARLSVVCLSVTLVHPTQAVEIFGNFSTAFGTLATL